MNKTELETKANVIEEVLTQHGIKGRIEGGVVAPRSVQFTLATIEPAHKVETLAGDLARALGAPEVQVARQGGYLVLTVKRTDAQPVKLLTMLSKLTGPKLPPCTAALGLCDDGAPLLVRLPSKDVGHVLVTGPDGCGKSSLLRTVAVSLALCNRPRDLKLVIVGRELGDLARLPHVLSYAADNERADRAAHDLLRLLGRIEITPRIVILIDDLGVVVTGGNLVRLLSYGHAAGIHVVASGSESLAGFKTLVAGKGEPGDFEVTDGGQAVRFTAATITPAEVGQVVIGAMPRREPTRLQLAAATV